MLSFCAGMANSDRDAADGERRDPGDADLLLLGDLAPLPHLRVEVVRDRRRRGQGQAGDHREDRREGDRRDQRQQHGAPGRAGTTADGFGQQRRGEVAAGAAICSFSSPLTSAAAPKPRTSVIR